MRKKKKEVHVVNFRLTLIEVFVLEQLHKSNEKNVYALFVLFAYTKLVVMNLNDYCASDL